MAQHTNYSIYVADAFYDSNGNLDHIELASMHRGSWSGWFGLNRQGKAERRNSKTGGFQQYRVARGQDFVTFAVNKFKATLEEKPENLANFSSLESHVSDQLCLSIAQVLLEEDDSHRFQIRRQIDVTGI